MSKVIEKIRREWKINDAKRDAGLTTPESILRYDDISYGADGHWQKLDIYRPKEARGPLPVIVNVHGGAWVYGDKELYQYYCMDLAKRGFAVVNFTYRLCPEFRFPAPIEDTDLVFRFMQEHADEYALDTDNIFAVGDSAGAHLLGLYLCALANPDYAAAYPVELKLPLPVKAAALNCGVYDLPSAYESDDQSKEIMGYFLKDGGTASELDFISVISHLSTKLPPLYLMTSTDDFLKGQAPALAQALCEKNVPFTFRLYTAEDRKGKLYHVFHKDIRSKEAIACNDEECAFFKGQLLS